jgi:hypothetical protein
MPKNEIDYSNTIIYKITCKNPAITDVYVGHTTNFVQRKHAHKQTCINNKALNHKCKVYEVIRANGGWENWHMEIINFFNCADHYAARKKEQEYFIELKATLNSIEPFPKPKVIQTIQAVEPKIKKVFFCNTCNIHCSSSNTLAAHNETNKHIKLLEDLKTNTSNTPTPYNFQCANCNFKCSKKSYWERHIITAKHIKLTNVNSFVSHDEKLLTYICSKCDKIYKSRVGLWKHSKKCIEETTANETEYKLLTSLMLEMVKNNKDLQKQMLAVCKNSDMK